MTTHCAFLFLSFLFFFLTCIHTHAHAHGETEEKWSLREREMQHKDCNHHYCITCWAAHRHHRVRDEMKRRSSWHTKEQCAVCVLFICIEIDIEQRCGRLGELQSCHSIKRRQLWRIKSNQFNSIQFNSIQFNSIQFNSMRMHSPKGKKKKVQVWMNQTPWHMKTNGKNKTLRTSLTRRLCVECDQFSP